MDFAPLIVIYFTDFDFQLSMVEFLCRMTANETERRQAVAAACFQDKNIRKIFTNVAGTQFESVSGLLYLTIKLQFSCLITKFITKSQLLVIIGSKKVIKLKAKSFTSLVAHGAGAYLRFL